MPCFMLTAGASAEGGAGAGKAGDFISRGADEQSDGELEMRRRG
jgi:hypothetical protein